MFTQTKYKQGLLPESGRYQNFTTTTTTRTTTTTTTRTTTTTTRTTTTTTRTTITTTRTTTLYTYINTRRKTSKPFGVARTSVYARFAWYFRFKQGLLPRIR